MNLWIYYGKPLLDFDGICESLASVEIWQKSRYFSMLWRFWTLVRMFPVWKRCKAYAELSLHLAANIIESAQLTLNIFSIVCTISKLVRISCMYSQQLYVTLIFWKTFSLWQTVTRFWLNICQSLANVEIWQQSRILFGGTIPVGLVRILYAHERTKIFDEPSNL